MGILADFVVKPSEFFGLGIPFFNVETAFEKRIPIKFKGGKYPVYHYIENGCGELVKALANMIRANGGKINTNQKVVKIEIEGNKAKRIKLESGESIDAEIIIVSGGLFNTFFNLVGKEYLPSKFNKKVKNITLMESVFMVHLGIDFNPRKFQREALCYYYGTYDIENGVKKCREGDYHEGKDGFLIYIPSFHSPKMAPKGKHAVTIYTIAPHKLKAGDWEDQKDQFADRLISFAEKIIPGLYEGTETKLIMTPNDFKQRINVKRNSFGGIAPIIGQENPNHKTPIKNLWYIGALSESGGGVMGVAAGAREVCKKIINEK
jgi:phytoene dehydrogenase-like protein